jgi:hypothetical protein
MNGKKAKLIRKKAIQLFIDWIRSMAPDGEDATKINKSNIHLFLPEETHFYANKQYRLSAYSLKWFEKKIKRNPNLTLENLNEDQNQKTGSGYWID